MKIIHLADTHLGFSAYRKTTEEGLNQRENDIYDSFKKCIDYIIETKPDLVLHAGDLFDSVRPTNRAITTALNQLLRLQEQNIPTVIIAGNHETPKLRETGHLFTIFDHLPSIYPIYKNKYEQLVFDLHNTKTCIHAIPHCHTKQAFITNIQQVKPDSTADRNILLLHGAVQGIDVFSMNEFNEQTIPNKILDASFDYIALGHYHKYTKLKPNTYYAGSTERFSFIEAPDKKGFIELTFDTSLSTKFIKCSTRDMKDLAPIDCTNKDLDSIMRQIQHSLSIHKPAEKIIRLTLENIPSATFHSLDFVKIKALTKEALHFELNADMQRKSSQLIRGEHQLESISHEFKTFLETQQLKHKETIKKLGLDYIQQVEEKGEPP